MVVDPFAGSGTTGIAALSLGRSCLLIDNNPTYCQKAIRRLREEGAAGDDELSPQRTLIEVKNGRPKK